MIILEADTTKVPAICNKIEKEKRKYCQEYSGHISYDSTETTTFNITKKEKRSFPVVVLFLRELAYEIACHVIKNRSVVLYVARGGHVFRHVIQAEVIAFVTIQSVVTRYGVKGYGKRVKKKDKGGVSLFR